MALFRKPEEEPKHTTEYFDPKILEFPFAPLWEDTEASAFTMPIIVVIVLLLITLGLVFMRTGKAGVDDKTLTTQLNTLNDSVKSQIQALRADINSNLNPSINGNSSQSPTANPAPTSGLKVQ